MTIDAIWEFARAGLLPIIGGILWWLWKLDRRQYELVSDQLKAQLNIEQTYISKETFNLVVARLEKTINDGVAELRTEILRGIRENSK